MKKYLFLSIMVLCTQNSISLNPNSDDRNTKLSRKVWNFVCHNFEDKLVMESTGVTSAYYPLLRDESRKRLLQDSSFRVEYPLLILNNVVIREQQQIDSFRSRIDYGSIKGITHVPQKRAVDMGIQSVPEDGALFVTLKKGAYFDLDTIVGVDKSQSAKWRVIERAYPFVDDETICKDKRFRIKYSFTYPLVVLKDAIIRDEQLINHFRNSVSRFLNLSDTKYFTKEQAEKLGIPNVPIDGALLLNNSFFWCFYRQNIDSLRRFSEPIKEGILDTIFPMESDGIVVSTGPDCLFLSVSDDRYYQTRMLGRNIYFSYPLLILNNVIIRDEQQVRCFRNKRILYSGKRVKSLLKKQVEQKRISNVPKDGVYFVTTKKSLYIDLTCD